MEPISFYIITQNEGYLLEALLSRVSSFVDEMIVVDGGSNDNTVAIAERLGARVVVHPFDKEYSEMFACQRNLALHLCQHDWIVWFDTDEVPPLNFLQDMQKLTARGHEGYLLKRRLVIDGKQIHDLEEAPDYQLKFFKCILGKTYYWTSPHEVLKGPEDIVPTDYVIEHIQTSSKAYKTTEFYDYLEQKKSLRSQGLTLEQESLFWYWDLEYGSEWVTALDHPEEGKRFANFLVNTFGRDIKVADIGCGIGNYLRPLSQLDVDCCGVDVSKALLELAEGLNVQIGNVIDLPYADQEFDAVLCFEVLEHLPESLVHKGLFELKRILKPKGSLILTIPGGEENPYHPIYLNDNMGTPAAGHLTLAGPLWWIRQFELLGLSVDLELLDLLEKQAIELFPSPTNIYAFIRE